MEMELHAEQHERDRREAAPAITLRHPLPGSPATGALVGVRYVIRPNIGATRP